MHRKQKEERESHLGLLNTSVTQFRPFTRVKAARCGICTGCSPAIQPAQSRFSSKTNVEVSLQ